MLKSNAFVQMSKFIQPIFNTYMMARYTHPKDFLKP